MTNKVLLPLGGRSVLGYSIRAISLAGCVSRVVLVVAETDRAAAEAILAIEKPDVDVTLVSGGVSRHASEWLGLQQLAPAICDGQIDVVVVHDAARPLARSSLFAEVIAEADAHGGAVPVRPMSGLIPQQAGIEPPGGVVVAVQTPQAFRAGPLLAAFERADRAGFTGSDTATCVERYADVQVVSVASTADNLKITYLDDLRVAEALLRGADVP